MSNEQTLSEADAELKARQALEKGGLYPSESGINLGHTTLDIVPWSVNQTSRALIDPISVDLDTQVSYEQRLGGSSFLWFNLAQGKRVVGPGAKMKMVFNGDGDTAQLLYSARRLASGPQQEIMEPPIAKANYVH